MPVSLIPYFKAAGTDLIFSVQINPPFSITTYTVTVFSSIQFRCSAPKGLSAPSGFNRGFIRPARLKYRQRDVTAALNSPLDRQKPSEAPAPPVGEWRGVARSAGNRQGTAHS